MPKSQSKAARINSIIQETINISNGNTTTTTTSSSGGSSNSSSSSKHSKDKNSSSKSKALVLSQSSAASLSTHDVSQLTSNVKEIAKAGTYL